MESSINININPQKIMTGFSESFDQVRKKTLAFADPMASQLDRVSEYLFGDWSKIAFTSSVMTNLASSYYELSPFTTTLIAVGAVSLISTFKVESEEDRTELAIERETLSELYYRHSEEVDEQEEMTAEKLKESYLEEYESLKKAGTLKAERQKNLYNLAQINLVANAASKALFGSASLGQATTAFCSILRVFN